ncbi:hypothetical protein EVA_08228, partial [gut metagenome]
MTFSLHTTLGEVLQRNGSDLHLCTGTVPYGRMAGELVPLSREVLTEDDMLTVLNAIASPSCVEEFKKQGE